MKSLTIGRRIILGFAAIVLINAVLGTFLVRQMRTISAIATVTTVQSLSGMDCVGRIESVAHDNNVLLLKDLMTRNDDLRDDLEAQVHTNLAQIAGILSEYEKTKTTAQARAGFNTFSAAGRDYAAQVAQVMSLGRAGKNQEAMELKQGQVDRFLDLIHAEEKTNKQNGDAAAEQVQTAAHTTQLSVGIGFMIMLLAACGVALAIILTTTRILKSLAAQLNSGANQVAGAAGQVSAASQSLATGSSEQAASIEETSASLEELSSMTKRNVDNAQQANVLAKQSLGSADRGMKDMQAMSSAMDAIKASSDDIAKIIKTIDEIAFQTNILALNAAVEAARAGEAGMGFAVVADEVRNLAQRSAQAAKETAAKIEGAIRNTTQGVELTGKVAKALNEIVTEARQMDELAAEVAAASREQSQGITQINAAVGEMDRVTQNNAASAEESAAAAEELKAQAEAMRHSVEDLLKTVGVETDEKAGGLDVPARDDSGFDHARQNGFGLPGGRAQVTAGIGSAARHRN